METEFNTVFELYQNIVVQAAALYTRNQHTAEDIAQEVFLRYYIYAGCGEVENVKGWLLTTARNLAYNYVRDHRKEVLLDVNTEGETLLGYGDSPEKAFFEKLWTTEVLETTDTILSALARKNEKWFDAVTLVYCMEKPQREVAESMGISYEGLPEYVIQSKELDKRKLQRRIRLYKQAKRSKVSNGHLLLR